MKNRLLPDTSTYSAFMCGEKFVVKAIQEADWVN